MGGKVRGKQKHQGRGQAAHVTQFKRTLIHSSILAVLGGVSLGAPSLSWAAEEQSLEALQRENEQLRQQLEALKRAAPDAANAQAEPVAPAAAATEVAPEQTEQAGSDEPTELDRVVVSGKKTLQRVKDIPQSISVVSGEDLKREDAVTLEAITKRLANVKWNYGNSSTSNYSIRGLGKIANIDNGDPSVGLYVDGIGYAFNQMAYFNFVDVDTVEVARGPQGTQFGRNASIGTIRVNYKRPSFTPYNEVTVGFSKYQDQDYGDSNGSVKATAVSTGPLIDNLLAYRTTVNVDKGGGWIRNSYNPDNRYISSDRVTGRMQLLLTPAPNLDIKFSGEVSPRNSENVNIGSTNFFFKATPPRYADGTLTTVNLTTEARLARPWFTRNTDYTVPGDYFNQEFIASDTQQGVVTGSNGANLEVNWNVADKYQLSSISGFRDYYFNAFRDDEGTVFDVQTAAGQNKVYSQASQEFRLVSQVEDLVDYQAGVFLQRAISDSAGNAIFGTDAGAWFASKQQYDRLDVTGPNGVSGRALLNDSLADLWKKTPTKSENTSTALYANADWHVTEPLTVNTGVRFGHEKRELTTRAFIKENGYGAALNPGNRGGFNSNNLGDISTSTNTPEQIALADSVAQRYFGVTTYASLTPAQMRQVADAKAIRSGRIGATYSSYAAKPYEDDIYTASFAPRYKFNENVTGYLSAAYGEKSGLPGVLSTSGTLVEYEVKPEKNTAFEIGAKSTLLGGDLLLNTAIYLNDIEDYQQNLLVLDELATAAGGGGAIFASVAGNVPKVRAQGVEIDGVYTGIKNTSLRFSGAYNDAYYKEFPNLAKPVERSNEQPETYRDASGETLPGASKWSFSVGANHSLPLANNKVFRSGFTTNYVSSFNSDNALSEYAVIGGYSTTDLSLGFGDSRGRAEVGFFVKNVFDDDTPRNKTWNAWAPGFPRQFGLTFTSRL
ncbi:TonB-dependent receptor [Solimonas sp. K1W22B-7]|uniref:TonB-dependent receptor n=1 Tax=Solimonas sp. K1W22B-7 TaxID=2303331 RepID=UPI0013C4E935|nr:TonB-dependent receptor [Solimonas sp. K1W22B-7]